MVLDYPGSHPPGAFQSVARAFAMLIFALGSASLLSGQDLSGPIPLPTITNADVHKFVLSNHTELYASVTKLEGDDVVLRPWEMSARPTMRIPLPVKALSAADQKFVQDWVARNGPDIRTRPSPALPPDGQAIALFLNETAAKLPPSFGIAISYRIDCAGVLKGKTIVALANGADSALTLCADGTLAAWGSNLYGELGNGRDGFDAFTIEPVLVDLAPFHGRKVVAIAAATYGCLVLCDDGSLFIWGAFDNPRPQDPTASAHNRPALFAQGALKGRKVVAIQASNRECLALCSDGRLVTWGLGPMGNGKIGALEPVLVDNTGVLKDKTVVKIAVNLDSSLVLCSDGTLVFWGAAPTEMVQAARKAAGLPLEAPGQPWRGAAQMRDALAPLALADETGARQGKTIIDIAAFGGFEALCSDGTLLAWTDPILLNSTAGKTHPNPLVASGRGDLEGKTIQRMASGGREGLALLCSDNTLVQGFSSGPGGVIGSKRFATGNILTGREVQDFTPEGYVLFKQPGPPEQAAATAATSP